MNSSRLLTRRELLKWSTAAALLPIRHARSLADARVLIIGAGFGGAACAKYLHQLSPTTQVQLIEQRSEFFTGPFTNLVISGLRRPADIRRNSEAIGRAHGVRLLIDRVLEIDPVKRTVHTAGGRTLQADCIVVAPGVSMRWNAIAGLDARHSDGMPHAWLGDQQVLGLRRRLRALRDGATVLIASPPNPYRCPPGPYERASLLAWALKQRGHGRSKIIIADSKDDFSKSGLFRYAWDTLYPGMIEWVPRAGGGEVVRVDSNSGAVWLRDSPQPIKTQLASIIPPQWAAELAHRGDLVDESGWCPIAADNFESTKYPGLYVIGDAAVASPMPKSAFSANSQAKLCACAIAAKLSGAAAPEARLLNTCYSMISDSEAISISGYYAAVAGRLAELSSGLSPLPADLELRRREARQAAAWYRNITTDSFGAE